MYRFIYALYFLLIGFIVFNNCTGSREVRELPPMPDYNSRSAYPDLITDLDKAQWEYKDNPIEASNLLEFNRVLGKYQDKLECKAKGDIMLSFVVTKKTSIDAPVIEQSLTENCDQSLLASLQFYKIDEPARIEG